MDIEELKLAALALPGSGWHAEMIEENEPAAPNVYRIYDSSDSSYEATICEMWSGEHDNDALSKYIALAHPSNVLALIRELEEMRTFLACAVDHADRWHNECRSGPVEGDTMMDAARQKRNETCT